MAQNGPILVAPLRRELAGAQARTQTGKPDKQGVENPQMKSLLKCLHKEESGQDLIEYALVGLIVALGAITGMGKLGASINAEFSKIAGKLS
jgi:Flp pilus assembly pilin Flp